MRDYLTAGESVHETNYSSERRDYNYLRDIKYENLISTTHHNHGKPISFRTLSNLKFIPPPRHWRSSCSTLAEQQVILKPE